MLTRQRAQAVYVGKAAARRLRWALPDLLDRAGGDRPPTPPRRLSYVGGGDFHQTGHEYLGLFKDLGGLRPDHHVLDVGCGIGRMAVPLMSYLADTGSYAGFDVGRSMIAWCQKNITSKRKDFAFEWAPVYNQKYNPFGTLSASEFRFPYPDKSFDFIFATSLFTHLTLSDTAHYLVEIDRVLADGGTCLLTFFLLRAESLAEIEAGRASLDFRFPIPGGLTINRHEPEAAVAFDLDAIEATFARTSLTICPPIHFGLWANTPGGAAGQDIVLARRGTSSPPRSAH
ncbi:MAG: class I SAM-dependent methyltransferase [Solirubrobacterales bacterium]